MGFLETIKSALYGPALIILIVNLYVGVIPPALVTISCWYMLISLIADIVILVIGTIGGFAEDDGKIMLIISLCISVATIVLGFVTFFAKAKILAVMQVTRAVTGFQWFAISAGVYFVAGQIIPLPLDLVGCFMPSDGLD